MFRSEKNFASPFELTFLRIRLYARRARTSCLNSSLRVIETSLFPPSNYPLLPSFPFPSRIFNEISTKTSSVLSCAFRKLRNRNLKPIPSPRFSRNFQTTRSFSISLYLSLLKHELRLKNKRSSQRRSGRRKKYRENKEKFVEPLCAVFFCSKVRIDD